MENKQGFKVALVQHKGAPNTLQENLEQGLVYVRKAKEQGADIVLFPEMWSNGYAPPFEGAFDDPLDPNFERERKQWLEAAVDEGSDYIQAYQEIAKRLQIGIVITYLSKGKTAPQNTALMIGKQGEILMKYSKVHTCDFSLEGLLESGDAFKVCEFEGVKLGIMICYDREFPESSRILMLKGAELILVPNACDMNPARLNQLSTRAFENMVGIAMANYPGKGWGQSAAFSPIVFDDEGYVDNQMMVADDQTEEIIVVSFDMEQIRGYRERETWGNAYRKVESYKDLIDRQVKEPFVRNH